MASPFEVAEFHNRSDVDASAFAQHHTLGLKHNQSAYGDHVHNGRDSKLLDVTAGSIFFGTEVGQHQYVVKPANAPFLTNDNTLNDDPDLVLPVLANATYKIDAFVLYEADATADFMVSFTRPAGSTIAWHGGSYDTAVNANYQAISTTDRGAASSNTAGRGIGTVCLNIIHGWLFTAGTAGNFNLSWAQSTLSANQVRLNANSVLELTRYA